MSNYQFEEPIEFQYDNLTDEDGGLLLSQYTKMVQTSGGRIRPDMTDLYELDLTNQEIVDDLESVFDLKSLGIHIEQGKPNPVIERQALVQYLLEDSLNKGDCRYVDRLLSMSDQPVEENQYLYGVYCWIRAIASQQNGEGIFDAFGVNNDYKYFRDEFCETGHFKGILSLANNMMFTGDEDPFLNRASKDQIIQGLRKSSENNGDWVVSMDEMQLLILRDFHVNDRGGIGHYIDWSNIAKRIEQTDAQKNSYQEKIEVTPRHHANVSKYIFPNEKINQLIAVAEKVITIHETGFLPEKDGATPQEVINLPGAGTISVILFTDNGNPALDWKMNTFGGVCERYLEWIDKPETKHRVELLKEHLEKALKPYTSSELKQMIQYQGEFIDGVQAFPDEALY